jgi:acetyl esterase/lipase
MMTQAPQPPSGNPPGPNLPGPPALTLARSIAPSDTSTSVLIDPPAGPQITTGAVRVSAYSDIVYATREAPGAREAPLRLDLLVPDTAGAKPLVVYLPGGGFVMASKEMALDRRRFVAEAGYAVASIEYRTVPLGATYRDAVADAKSAIRFLRAHAADYGIDTSKVAVWGESAGGYLVSMIGVTNGSAQFETPDNAAFSSDVQAVIDLFGATDLAKIAADFDPDAQRAHLAPGNPAAAFVFGPGTERSLADDPAAVAEADPSTYAGAATPPFLIFHGSGDNVISPSQTLLLHTALLKHGVPSTRYVLDGAGHGDLAAMLGDPEAALPWSTRQLLGYITDFLGQHLQGGS